MKLNMRNKNNLTQNSQKLSYLLFIPLRATSITQAAQDRRKRFSYNGGYERVSCEPICAHSECTPCRNNNTYTASA